jgi:hypothetical protein
MKPTKMPRKTIHIKTIIKEKTKTLNVAFIVNKKGINGTNPPKSVQIHLLTIQLCSQIFLPFLVLSLLSFSSYLIFLVIKLELRRYC